MSDQTRAQILAAGLVDLDVKGVKWPCRNRPEWTSDSTAEQELAAAACAPCPLINQCAAAARELKATAGVWAGVPHDFKTYTKPRKAVA